jgi:hypothetical protein
LFIFPPADSTPFLANNARQSGRQVKLTAVDYDLAKTGINEMQTETGYFALMARQAVAKVDVIHQGVFSKNAVSTTTIGSMMNSMGSWKTRNYKISKNQQLEYIDPSDGEVKGTFSIAVVQFEKGVLANVTSSGFGGPNAYALNVKDMLSTPPTALELVFNNINDAKSFVVAVNFVADESNVKSFCKAAQWDPVFLTSFSPRLAKKSHVLCRTACCCANCSFTKCSWDSLGSADFCYCCCLQFFGQCGFSRTAKALHNANLKAILKEDNDEVKDCMTMCGTMCDAAEIVVADARHHKLQEEHVTDDLDVNPLIVDFKSNSCCCYMCDIPFLQIRFFSSSLYHM